MKVIRHPEPPAPPSRPIMQFEQPAPGPHHKPPSTVPATPSNDLAAETIRKAANPGGIDPRQMRK